MTYACVTCMLVYGGACVNQLSSVVDGCMHPLAPCFLCKLCQQSSIVAKPAGSLIFHLGTCNYRYTHPLYMPTLLLLRLLLRLPSGTNPACTFDPYQHSP